MRTISKDVNLHEEAKRLEQVIMRLGRHHGLRDPIVAAVAEELTPPQMHALLWLGFEGALNMGDLAQRNSCTEKTITGVVDRMEVMDLFKRERDAADRRVVWVKLTAKGSAKFAILRERMVDRMHSFLRLLDDGDRAALFRILDKLLKGLDEATARTEVGVKANHES